MRYTLRHFVTDTTLPFNQCIAFDKELAIFKPLRIMIYNVPCLNKSHHRLDKHHSLIKRYNASVLVSISGKETETILIFLINAIIIF